MIKNKNKLFKYPILLLIILFIIFGFYNLFKEKIILLPNHKLLNQKISFNKTITVAIRDESIGAKKCAKLCQLSGGVNRNITEIQSLGSIWQIPLEYIRQDRIFIVTSAFLDKTFNIDSGPSEMLILQDINNKEKYKISAIEFESYSNNRIYSNQIANKQLFEVAEKNGNNITVMINLKSKNLSDNEMIRIKQITDIQDNFIKKLPNYFTGKNSTKDKYNPNINMNISSDDLAYLISSKVPLNIDSISKYETN